jgi:hypothetical protein
LYGSLLGVGLLAQEWFVADAPTRRIDRRRERWELPARDCKAARWTRPMTTLRDTAWPRFGGGGCGYPVTMPDADPDQEPDDHRELFEAERNEAEVEEEREEEAERRTDRAHEEYEAEKEAPG